MAPLKGRFPSVSPLALCAWLLIVQPACKRGSCIQPPETYVSDSTALGIALSLERLPITADIKADFKNTLTTHFSTLSDRNAALLLFQRAILCYLQENKAGEVLAKEMMALLREYWSQGRGTTQSLTDLERADIDRSPYAHEILTKFERFGVK